MAKSAKKAAKKKPVKKAPVKSAKKPVKKAAKKAPKKAAKKIAKKKTARKPNAAFMRPLTPSPALAAVIGFKPMPRTEVIRAIWVHIKKNGLQDSKNKRMINADEKLKEVFGKGQVSMFELAGILGDHLT
jgi:upstream activation factor subunit UAF30